MCRHFFVLAMRLVRGGKRGRTFDVMAARQQPLCGRLLRELLAETRKWSAAESLDNQEEHLVLASAKLIFGLHRALSRFSNPA